MSKRGPKFSTKFFIFAIELLACSLVVSILAWIGNNLFHWLPAASWLLNFLWLPIAALGTFFLLMMFAFHLCSANSANRIGFAKQRVALSLFAYWLSIIAFFVFIVGIFRLIFYGNSLLGTPFYYIPEEYWSGSGEILPWVMALMSILLLFVFISSEYILLKAGKHWNSFTPARIILFLRFVILGELFDLLETRWASLAVKFFNILFATWMAQSISRILWQSTETGISSSIFKISFKESILSPANPANGSIFNGFLTANQSILIPLDFSGRHFALDIASSIFSLLWHHWTDLVAIWLILETLGYLWESSSRIVIVNSSGGERDQKSKDDGTKGKDDLKKAEPVETDLGELLAVRLDRIKQIYQAVDEKRPIPSACGAGEPIDAAIKVDSMEDISLSSTSEIRIGPIGIPASSVSALISHMLRGPKITIGLYRREDHAKSPEKEKEKSRAERAKLVLIASMSGRMGSRRWIVDCPDPLEEEYQGSERSIEDMIAEMAHRIHASYADLQSKKQGQTTPWKAMWNFNEGLRAYRDCLVITKKRKYFLNRAEKKFIDALEEYSNFDLAYYNLGVVYAELNQLNSAEACFQKAIEVNPYFWEAYYALALIIFRRAKDIEQKYIILELDIPDIEFTMVLESYRRTQELCRRVLDIKKSIESKMDIDYSFRAKSRNLEGNALMRLAYLNQNGMRHNQPDKNCNFNKFLDSKYCLEDAVHYSWMAMITDSILHKTSESQSKIVSECTLDLADAYLKISRLDDCRSNEMKSNMRSILQQAIYINPQDVNLYYLLARGDEPHQCSHLLQEAYAEILRINPKSSRIRAHIAANKAKIDIEPASWLNCWLEKCEKSGCCSETDYERVYRGLAMAIEDNDCLIARKHAIDRDTLVANLKKLSERKEGAISALQRALQNNDRPSEEYLRICLSLVRLYRYLASCSYCDRSLDFERLGGLLHASDIKGLICNIKDDSKIKRSKDFSEILKCAECLYVLGSIYLELAKIRIDENICRINTNAIIKGNLECICKDQRDNGGNESPNETRLDEPSSIRNYLDVSLKCLIRTKSIIEEEFKGKDLLELYKREKSYYQVEVGRKLLDLSKLYSDLNQKDETHGEDHQPPETEDLNKYAKELFIEAIKTLDTVDFEEIKRNKLRFYLAKAYFACGDLQNALIEAQNAKELNPLDCEERKFLGEIFCKLKEFKFGLSELNTAITYRPNDSDLLLCIGKAYFLAGKDCKRKGEERNRILRNARERLYEALEIVDKSEIWTRGVIRYWIGRILMEMGSYEAAIPHLRILVRKEKNFRDPLPAIYLGYALMKCNSHGECEDILYGLIKNLKKRYETAAARKFYGQQYDEERHINEVLARAYVYLAYSYVERDANLCDSWRLAYESQKYINDLKEPHLKAEERARDGVLPEVMLEWDDICGKESEKLKEILVQIFGFDWARDAEIKKIGCNWIRISAKKEAAILESDREGSCAILKKNGSIVHRFKTSMENNELYVHFPDMSDVSCHAREYRRLSLPATSPVPAQSSANHDASQMTSSSIPAIDEGSRERLWDGYAIDGMENFKIRITFNPKDGLRKRKGKAHLAECAGTICYKMGDLNAAIDYLRASIALYPDAGAYINLARAYERILLCEEDGKAGKPKKALINRMIRNLCRHAEALDLRDEHKKDLEYFKKVCREREKDSSAGPAEPSRQ